MSRILEDQPSAMALITAEEYNRLRMRQVERNSRAVEQILKRCTVVKNCAYLPADIQRMKKVCEETDGHWSDVKEMGGWRTRYR